VCFDLLARFVDLELAGGDPDPRLSVFRQHLEQCAVCREEYEVVSELARLEADGRS
jgi:predicted anti-sigma-YlaC factor YlaD